MQDVSPRLSLPLIQPSQAQKHVTHNEAVMRLDLLAQLVVESFDAATPPAIALEGQAWALGPAPTDAWAGGANQIAVYQNAGWVFVEPQAGWCAAGRDDLSLRLWSGSAWDEVGAGDLNQLDGLGIGTNYDATNALAVSSDASLLTHDGAGHQLKINKAGALDTASLLFQTNWSGRAEMGTAGSDDFEIKVSSDGANWATGLRVAASTGQLSAPVGLTVDGTVTGSAVMQDETDDTAGRLMTTGAFGIGTIAPPFVSDIDATEIPSGVYATSTPATSGTFPTATSSREWGQLISVRHSANDSVQIYWDVLNDTMFQRRYRGASGGWQAWRSFWDSGNSTVDANGFIKQASPIVRLSSDGITEPVTPVGARFSRRAAGHYVLSDVAPLAVSGWQIEVPQDHNGNRLVFVSTQYNVEDRVLDIRTSKVVWDRDTGMWAGGAPVDIPVGRWVDIRLSEPESAITV